MEGFESSPCHLHRGLPGLQDPTCRSHTLVFAQPDAAVTKAVVEALAARGVQVDCRKNYLRIGFGANHGMDDVDALLTALQGLAAPRP